MLYECVFAFVKYLLNENHLATVAF